MDKQYVVLGLGIFGSTVVKTLSEYGCEILAIDKDPECVSRIAEYATKAVIGDVTDLEFLKSLGVDEFDIGIMAIGDHLEEAVLATMNLKECGVPYIVAKAKNKRFKVVLEKVGADSVIRPEKDMGVRLAKRFLRKNITELIELDSENSIAEIIVPQAWVGKTLNELNLRQVAGINILGKRNPETNKLELPVDPHEVLKYGDRYIVLARTDKIEHYDLVV